jgi:hypothetical protein
MHHGKNAYVLCGTHRHSSELMTSFGCDSFFRINEPTLFALAVGSKLRGFVGGIEGLCIYQTTRVVERDLGYLHLPPAPPDCPDWKVDRTLVERMVHESVSHFPYLLKHKRFEHQNEYRIIWLLDHDVDDYVDIEVPEAKQFCSGPDLFSP